GYVRFERRLSGRLITVLRDTVTSDAFLQAERKVDLVGEDDTAAVVAAVHDLVPRVFVLAAEDDTDWVNAVLMPTLESSGGSSERRGDGARGGGWKGEVIGRLLRSDRVVVVLSKAYLRGGWPQVDTLVMNAECAREETITLPVLRDEGVELPARYKPVLAIDA